MNTVLKKFGYFLIIFFPLGQSIIPTDSFQAESSDKNKSMRELNQKGINLAKEGKYKEALEKFQYLEYIDGMSAILYNNLGYTYQLKGDSPKAIESYKKSVGINPKLISPRQNLGKLLFESGKCKQAIFHGEYALSIDPTNSKVKKWLPAAHEKCKKFAQDKEKQIFEPRNILLNLAWETLKIDYSIKNIFTPEGGLDDYLQPIGLKLPMKFNLDVRTYFQLKLKLESLAFTGTLNPVVIPSQEIIELGHWFEKLYVGFGMMFTQMNLTDPSVPFGAGSVRTIKDIFLANDFKLGLSFEHTSNTYEIKTSVFPRYLFRDSTSGSHGVSFDRNFLSIINTIKTNWNFGFWTPRFLVNFVINEWYITEYQPVANVPIRGHYFAYYDLDFGVSVGELPSKKKFSTIGFGLKITARAYFLDLNDTNPFAFGNGQGFFGLTTGDEALQGKILSGFRTYATTVSFSSKQSIYYYFIIEESIAYTYVGSGLNVFDISLKFSFHI